ncbi:MAG TPA: glycosyltransferase family 2 protein [Rhodanobacteraceae bacterium]|nr:glycosyltransferase family 2 protein [Rhodanobacteraceae bacterium]
MNEAAVRPFVVLPCLNEALAIRNLLEGVLAHCRDVIVIDDGSIDDTAAIVARMPVTLIRHPERRGKGEALRAGFREALKRGATGVLTMDGDGQHDPADIPRILAAARQFPGAMIIGARMLERERQPAGRRRANDFADWGISWGCGRPVADTQSGQRWYPHAAVELVDLPAQDFVFEAAILIAASRDLDMPVVSIPIVCRYDSDARHSHFRSVRDTVRITWYTMRRVAHYGSLMRSYRASHASPPRICDPEHLLDAPPPSARLAGVGGPPGNEC